MRGVSRSLAWKSQRRATKNEAWGGERRCWENHVLGGGAVQRGGEAVQRGDEDALDVLQETFAYVVRNLPDLKLSAQMRTFLYPAIKHLALARRRASRRHRSLEEALGADRRCL